MLWSWWGFLVLFFSSLIVWTCYLLILNRVLSNIITFLLTIKLHITNLAGWNLCDSKMSKMTSDRFSVTFDAVFFFLYIQHVERCERFTQPDDHCHSTRQLQHKNCCCIDSSWTGRMFLSFPPTCTQQIFSLLQDLHAGECHHGAVSSCCLHSGVEGNGSSHPQLSINLVYKWSKWNG